MENTIEIEVRLPQPPCCWAIWAYPFPSLNLSSPSWKGQELSVIASVVLSSTILQWQDVYLHLSWHVYLTYKFPETESPFAKVLGKRVFVLYHLPWLVLTKCLQALWAEILALTPESSCHQEERQAHVGHRLNLSCPFPSYLWGVVRAQFYEFACGWKLVVERTSH